MSTLTNRRSSAVRTLAGSALAAALLVSTATACSSPSPAPGTAAPAAAPTTPSAQGTIPPAAAPSAPTTPDAAAPASTPAAPPAPAPGTAAPAATPTARHTTTTPPAAPPKGTSPVRTQKLVDGSTAEIRATGNQNYTAKIVNNGTEYGTLETHDSDAGVDFNDMFIVLSLDGTAHSWMGGGHQGPGTFKLAGGWTAKVTKIGELHYRAQILGNDGAVNGTLEANQQDAGAVANGVYMVLSTGGEISAKM
ncbi:hypothetical protein ACFVHI_26885 [Kitasatospora sp. NPDC127121]|uniref:hypothetical protein n=1 Tax=Kitasatospora sp. NPDC127121 TaxID=3345371 RepID=UPI0036323C02